MIQISPPAALVTDDTDTSSFEGGTVTFGCFSEPSLTASAVICSPLKGQNTEMRLDEHISDLDIIR